MSEAHPHGPEADPRFTSRTYEPKANGAGHQGSASAPERPIIFTAPVLQAMRFPPVSYVVPGYVAEGLTLLAGKPKLGKSWLMLDLAIAVARGGFALGNVQCDEGDVLYAALEDNPRRLQRRMTKLLGAFTAWPERITFRTEMPRLDAGGIAHVREWIEGRVKPRLVIVDTLAKVRGMKGAQETNYEGDYRAVGELKALADEMGVAVVLVHHVRKMEAEDPLDTVSGTTGLTGAVDTILVFNRDAQGVTLYGRGRDIEEVEAAVRFNAETCRWEVLGEASEVRRTDERGSILATLDDADAPMSPTDLAGAIGKPTNNVKQLLFKMAKAGEVSKAGSGRYIHPQRTDLDDRKPARTSPPGNRDNPITRGGAE